MKEKLKQACVQGMIDMLVILYVIGGIAYFEVYTLEKYFM